MHLPTRYVTKITAASVSLIIVSFVCSLAVHSQEPAQNKPATAAPTQTPAPAQSPSPAPQQKMGTELDDRTLITNTVLITLTVTSLGPSSTAATPAAAAPTPATVRKPLRDVSFI